MTPTDEFHHDDEHKIGEGEGDWVSNEPPVDDFGDPADEASVSEGDEHVSDESAEQQIVEEKKKLPLLLIGGILAVLGIGGGVAFWQLAGHRDDPSMLDMAAQNATPMVPNFGAKEAVAPVEKPAAAVPAEPAKPVPAAPDVAPKTAYSVPSTAPEAPAAKPVAPEVATAPAPTVATNPTPAPAAPVIDKVVLDVPAPAPQPVKADERLTSLSNRLDDLQKSLGQTTLQISQISDKLSAVTPATATAPAESNPQLEDRLNKLEQKLLQMEQHQTTTMVHTAAVEKVIPASAVRKPKPAAHHKAEPKKVVKAKSKDSAWVLRAATMDEAWIAKGTETRELRPVHVGDDLPVIGKVTAIKQVGGAWILQGVNGTIK